MGHSTDTLTDGSRQSRAQIHRRS